MTSLSVLSCKLLFKLAITSHCELYSFFPLVCYTIFDFEDHDLSNWTLNGTAFSNQPTYGDNPSERLKNDPTRKEPSKHQGHWWIGTYENRSSPSHPAGEKQDDEPQGSMTSPRFFNWCKLSHVPDWSRLSKFRDSCWAYSWRGCGFWNERRKASSSVHGNYVWEKVERVGIHW